MKLKALREAKHLSQQELASQAGVSVGTIHRIETGKVKPHKSILRLIAGVLDVAPAELVD